MAETIELTLTPHQPDHLSDAAAQSQQQSTAPESSFADQIHATAYAEALSRYGMTQQDVNRAPQHSPRPVVEVNNDHSVHIDGQATLFDGAAQMAAEAAVATHQAEVDAIAAGLEQKVKDTIRRENAQRAEAEARRAALDATFKNELQSGKAFHDAMNTRLAEAERLATFQWRPATLADVEAGNTVPPVLVSAEVTPVPVAAEAPALTVVNTPAEVVQTPQSVQTPVVAPARSTTWNAFGTPAAIAETAAGITNLDHFRAGVRGARVLDRHAAYQPAVALAEAAAVATAPVPSESDIKYVNPDGSPIAAAQHVAVSRPHPHRTRAERAIAAASDATAEYPTAAQHREAVITNSNDDTGRMEPIRAAANRQSAPYDPFEDDPFGDLNDDHAVQQSSSTPVATRPVHDAAFDLDLDDPDDDQVAAPVAAEAADSATDDDDEATVRKQLRGIRARLRGARHNLRGILRGDHQKLPEGEYVPGYNPADNPDLVELEDGTHYEPAAFELPRGGMSKGQYRRTMTKYYNGKLESPNPKKPLPTKAERLEAVDKGLVEYKGGNVAHKVSWVNTEAPAIPQSREQRNANVRAEIDQEVAADTALHQEIADNLYATMPQGDDEANEDYQARIDSAFRRRVDQVYFDETLRRGVALRRPARTLGTAAEDQLRTGQYIYEYPEDPSGVNRVEPYPETEQRKDTRYKGGRRQRRGRTINR